MSSSVLEAFMPWTQARLRRPQVVYDSDVSNQLSQVVPRLTVRGPHRKLAERGTVLGAASLYTP